MLNDLSNHEIREMNFDSSLFNSIDSQLTPGEFWERLELQLQPILNKEFYNIKEIRDIKLTQLLKNNNKKI
jgi:hypothetical protein